MFQALIFKLDNFLSFIGLLEMDSKIALQMLVRFLVTNHILISSERFTFIAELFSLHHEIDNLSRPLYIIHHILLVFLCLLCMDFEVSDMSFYHPDYTQYVCVLYF